MGPSGLRACAAACLALIAALGTGCTDGGPRFHANVQDYVQMLPAQERGLDAFRPASGVDDEDRQARQARLDGVAAISTALLAGFGTPDEPYLLDEFKLGPDYEAGLDLARIRRAAGPPGIEEGGRRGLFRLHCAHCHGISGDGAGPTAMFLDPFPRDYRQGVYKFKSTEFDARPTREDLHRTVTEGIQGTAMPSFVLLPRDERDDLVEYVIYLSVRGMVEAGLALEVIPEGTPLTESTDPDAQAAQLKQRLVETGRIFLDEWYAAAGQVIQPDLPEIPEGETPREAAQRLAASIGLGKALFEGKGGCVKCHGPTGMGDGMDKLDYDIWNKFKIESPKTASTWLLPVQGLVPRNLRQGIYRGGRRPVDIYRRIHAGIPGTPMSGAAAANPPLSSEEIWHITDYVMWLPYADQGLPAAGVELARSNEP